MLEELRRKAVDLVRAHDWESLLLLEERLREDTRQWVSVWAPACALAARSLGLESARSYLDEAIVGGFFQPEIFEPEMSQAFGADEDWADLLAAMAANTPPPPLELHAWPTIRPTAPLELYQLDAAREDVLRSRMPAPAGTAWEAAKSLLSWVTHAWEHTSNDHVKNEDAIEVLDRVAAGERFACVEYSIVLSQALNAARIPARRAVLTIANHHAGYGTGHVVSEAWIDDLNKWVVLDGQNGFYWVAPDGTPLGVLELQELYRAGVRADVECLRRPFSDDELKLWWNHFHAAFVNGAAWRQGSFTPYFEGSPSRVPVLVADALQAYPDLAELGIAFVVSEGRQAIQPLPVHPFATGYRITDGESHVDLALTEPWVFPARQPGDHQMEIAVRTDYGTLRPFTIKWTAN